MVMTEVVVEDDVLPPIYRERHRYPHARMKVGESFCVPVANRNAVVNANGRAGKRLGMVFVSRTEGDVVRTWRVK
jgi:hypothetical protein